MVRPRDIPFCILVVVVIVGLFMLAMNKAARAADYRVPSICLPLAERYGVPGRLAEDQARRAVAELDQHTRWPGVRQCRAAIRREWRL